MRWRLLGDRMSRVFAGSLRASYKYKMVVCYNYCVLPRIKNGVGWKTNLLSTGKKMSEQTFGEYLILFSAFGA